MKGTRTANHNGHHDASDSSDGTIIMEQTLCSSRVLFQALSAGAILESNRPEKFPRTLEIPTTRCVWFLKIALDPAVVEPRFLRSLREISASFAQRRLRVGVRAAGTRARAPLPPLRGPAVDLRSLGAASTRSGANCCEPATNLISRRFMACFLSGPVPARSLRTGDNCSLGEAIGVPLTGTRCRSQVRRLRCTERAGLGAGHRRRGLGLSVENGVVTLRGDVRSYSQKATEPFVNAETEAAIDDVLMGSFPASDPPPWTLGVTSQEADMKVRCRTVDSVLAEVEGLQRHIAQRAQEIFRARGGAVGQAVEDWIKAERETIWRPALEVRRTRDAFVVEAAIAGIDPKQLDLQVTPTELVLGAPLHHSDREQEGEVVVCEFAKGPLFRSYTFPDPVDPARVSAQYRNGMLRVTAPLAQPATKVEVEAA